MIDSFLIFSLIEPKKSAVEAFLKEQTKCKKVYIKERNISSVSLLYKYTNTPPLAYGSPAPKVAESIIRSRKYNYAKNNGRDKDKQNDRQYWTEEDGEFPNILKDPSSNIMSDKMLTYCKIFVQKNKYIIDKTSSKIIKEIMIDNADVLTKGRQTWDPFSRCSVASPDAFKEMMEFFQKNTKKSSYTMIEWIQCWSDLFNKETILYKKRTRSSEETKINKMTAPSLKRKRMSFNENWIELKGLEAKEFLMNVATEFCSYLKTKERSKLKRRAIASANMILRMFFEIIERFHLTLGKTISGSTISIGGIEKQTKIMNGLNSVPVQQFSILATEDATKWNECLSPAGFAIMHYCFFDYEFRKKNRLLTKEISESQMNLMNEIFLTGIYLLSLKRIFLGQTHVIENKEEDIFGRDEKWFNIDIEKYNKNTKEWYNEIKNDIDERDCVYSPYGMLMGMLNAASTTYGLMPTINENKMSCMRSSDDSITLFTGDNIDNIWNNIQKFYSKLKMIGINPSIKKNLFFRWPFGEYTSWYIDGEFSSQYGTEISSLRPKGDTPHTDFHSNAIETNVALREYRINNVGAEMMLALKNSNTRRLWRIKKDPKKREEISENVLLLSDGGLCPWHSTNTFLNEISVKKNYCKTQNEKDYIEKITNICNPFSQMQKERLTYSKDVGAIINEVVETPKNIFTFMKRPNKTLKTNFKIKEKREIEAAQFVVDLCEAIEPAFAIMHTSNKTSCHEFIENNIKQIVSISADDSNENVSTELNEQSKILMKNLKEYII